MSVLGEHGIARVYHYAPMHYMAYIASSGALLTKPSLLNAGFEATHFRSTSHHHDVQRGFGAYSFLTLDPAPRILSAKLSAGFPHVRIAVPATSIEEKTYSLCRFNVAKTRQLRRSGKPGHPETPGNGVYYDGHEIPIARTSHDKNEMLNEHYRKGVMIEVLLEEDLPLPSETEITCYCEDDISLASEILQRCNRPWRVLYSPSPVDYPHTPALRDSVNSFVMRVLDDPSWRGDGLEFDRL